MELMEARWLSEEAGYIYYFSPTDANLSKRVSKFTKKSVNAVLPSLLDWQKMSLFIYMNEWDSNLLT